MRKYLEATADRPTLGIVAAVHQARNTGLNDGARTHAARLDGDIQYRSRETVVAKYTGRFPQDHNLGMRGGVAIADGAIAGTGDDLAIVDEHGADRDFTSCCRRVRFVQRSAHEFDIGIHPD